MSPVQPNWRIYEEGPRMEERIAEEEDDLEEKETIVPPLNTVNSKDQILRQHDALRQGMDKFLSQSTGLWEENLSLKNEVEFWKNEWRRTLRLGTKDCSLKDEVERSDIAWRRRSIAREENVSLKNQVEQLKRESRLAEQAREELEAKVAKFLRRTKLGTKASSTPHRGVAGNQPNSKEKWGRIEAEKERNSSKEEDLRRQQEELLRRKDKEALRNARELEKQRRPMAPFSRPKRKEWEKERNREVEVRIERRLKMKKRSGDEEDVKELEGKDPKAYEHSWKGELHIGRSSSVKVQQLTHFDDDQIPQKRVPGPAPSAPPTLTSAQDCDEEDTLLVPDPDFHDFDANRTEKDILPGQIWAIYDDQDGMPRLYAKISRVSPKPFKAYVNWLNECPATEEEILWMKSNGRSIACGDFKLGRSFRVMDQINTFSHFVMDKVARGVQKIYPKKGQVWAVYKDAEQAIEPSGGKASNGQGKTHKYEMVEILSEFCDTEGLKTHKLIKVKGLKTVFRRQDGTESFRSFPPEELVKFSHGVPNHRFEDLEAESSGVPRGSVELDPASTPVDLITSTSDPSTVDRAP